MQRLVVAWVPTGLKNAAIGRKLSITIFTVKKHLHDAKKKLGYRTRVELAALAVRKGWHPVEVHPPQRAKRVRAG